jgi:Rod binding domain-containing protein
MATALLPPPPPSAPPQPGAAETAARRAIAKTAQDFETQFLGVMLQQMYQGVGDDDAVFGGGPGEQMFKSFLTDAMAKQISRTGGIGIAAAVSREMLEMQGLT